MATYILFWNPYFSSYTKARFIDDFAYKDSVGNWSFYEHDNVRPGDVFFMVKCGQQGKTGIVMRGIITSSCYESSDWSPKNRRHIFYADLRTDVCVNPWAVSVLLSPERLTEEIPGFNWFGGHSGRLLDDEAARKLEKIWLRYLDSSQTMFCDGDAWVKTRSRDIISGEEAAELAGRHGYRCEICGYSYSEVFGGEEARKLDLASRPTPVFSPLLKRLMFNLCPSCVQVPDGILAGKLVEIQDRDIPGSVSAGLPR